MDLGKTLSQKAPVPAQETSLCIIGQKTPGDPPPKCWPLFYPRT